MARKAAAPKRRSARRPAARRSTGGNARRRKPAGPPPAPDDLTRVGAAGLPPGAAAPAAVLRVLRSPDASLVQREFPVGFEDVTLGRDASNVIAVADPDVSRHHARIVRTGTSHVLVDMESTNGTLINGKRVSEVTLRPGDRLVLGSTTLVYES